MKHLPIIDTDVLVIGGGMAAMFAALKAKNDGARVTVVDKGYAGLSGQSPYADGYAYVAPDGDLEKVVQKDTVLCEYLNERDWCAISMSEAYDRLQEIKGMGVDFFETPAAMQAAEGDRGVQMANIKGIVSINVIRNHVAKQGVNFTDRVMVTDLIPGKDGNIIGAVGIGTQEETIYTFQAKAVILCTGGSAYKPNGWPSHGLTGDGDAMAYRLGARITGKEFVDPHTHMGDNPGYSNYKHKFSVPKARPAVRRMEKGDGSPMRPAGGLYIFNEMEIHDGKGPIVAQMRDGTTQEVNGGLSSGMSIHKGEGVYSEGYQCETDLKGLYAAGDSLGNRQAGSVYPGGMALAGSAVSGARSGHASAAYVKEMASEAPDAQVLEPLYQRIMEPRDRVSGYSPRWVINQVQNLMLPYYTAVVKEEKRLLAVLAMIEFLRDHTLPKMRATDAHELVLALEAKNIVLNAEMRLRASLFRKETRGTHVREDYPLRDDENFLVWITMRDVDGEMTLETTPVPDAWKPDPSLTYEEKYPRHWEAT